MATNTQEIHEPTSERVTAHYGGVANAGAGAGGPTELEMASALDAWLRLEEGRLKLMLRRRVANWLMAMTTVTIVAALAAVFFNASGAATIPERVVIALLALNVAPLAGMSLTVVKNLFPPE